MSRPLTERNEEEPLQKRSRSCQADAAGAMQRIREQGSIERVPGAGDGRSSTS
ncbi:hypothetical protein XAPC_3835 [Xanthomonas citri pv. punicae str. LMG 859]|nr:hypothetical protein XAPC_3835 [Xanthomonas citri pv. punicae str. LMG 859]